MLVSDALLSSLGDHGGRFAGYRHAKYRGLDLIGQGLKGKMVSAVNVKGLAEAMASSIWNPAGTAEMGLCAYVRACQFTWDSYGRKYRKEILG